MWESTHDYLDSECLTDTSWPWPQDYRSLCFVSFFSFAWTMKFGSKKKGTEKHLRLHWYDFKQETRSDFKSMSSAGTNKNM